MARKSTVRNSTRRPQGSKRERMERRAERILRSVSPDYSAADAAAWGLPHLV